MKKAKAMDDFADVKPEEITFEILSPRTGENAGIRVTVMSSDDERMKPIMRRIQNGHIDRNKRGKTIKSEEIEENALDLLAAAVVSWEWYGTTWKGEVPEHSRKNVKEVLRESASFRKQVNEKVDDTEAFFSE